MGTARQRRKDYKDSQRRKIWIELERGGKSAKTYKEGRFG